MNYYPFDLALIESHLAELKKNRLVSNVGGMVEFTAIKALNGMSLPSLFVVMGSEIGAESKAGRQVVQSQFGVAVAVRNIRAGTSGTASQREDLNAILAAVRERLIGWLPSPLHTTPVSWVRGELLDYDNNVLVWLEQYQTRHVLGGATCK